MSFPKDFVWGAAAAAYQIEGAAAEDGKGPSVWDTFCATEGKIKNGDTGETACDHYHRYTEDVALMKMMGLQAYRLSISWPRVLPEGIGRVNQKGLDYYSRLVDELLKNGIEPYITLFHWDYPEELFREENGWLNPMSSEWFAEYAKIVTERLSDRVKNWITLNEPQVFIAMGHHNGEHAPGLRLPFKDILTAVHNALLAHGKAVSAIRSHSKQECRIGIAPVGSPAIPTGTSPEDIEAAREETFRVLPENAWGKSWWLDPVFLGKYPDDGLLLFEKELPDIHYRDMEIIKQPLDFCGLNIYRGGLVRAGKDGTAENVPFKTGYDRTAFKWPVTPDALYWGPKFVYDRYKLPVLITENGLSNTDWVQLDGKIHDPQRIDYATRYLRALHRAGQDGVELAGYFHWSIMDNFEWAEGYGERFGLIHVDFESQKRTLKDSAYWYRDVIAGNGDPVLG